MYRMGECVSIMSLIIKASRCTRNNEECYTNGSYIHSEEFMRGRAALCLHNTEHSWQLLKAEREKGSGAHVRGAVLVS